MSQRFSFPTLTDSGGTNTFIKSHIPSNDSNVIVKECNGGYGNPGLEISKDFVEVANHELINRELVNLENAAVNIDNSNDVIIGPVTQFNINGEVTIYQNKDGQPIGFGDKIGIPNGHQCNHTSRSQKENPDVVLSVRKKIALKVYVAIISIILIVGVSVISIFVLRKNTQKPDGIPEGQKELDNSASGSHAIISKTGWGGRIIDKTDMPLLTLPIEYVIVKHTGGGTCDSFTACAKKMQTIQSVDISVNRLDDIYFNFAVGGDGNVYEGRGWTKRPADVNKFVHLDLVMIGNFAIDEFTAKMKDTSISFLEYGLKHGKLSKDYKLVNHNQTSNTLSPGDNVIKETQTWPHYDGELYIGEPLSGPVRMEQPLS